MIHLLKTVFMIMQIKGTMAVNRIIFYLMRFPIIGKKIPDKAFDLRDIKLMVTILSLLYFIGRNLVTKTFYVLILILSIFMLTSDMSTELIPLCFVHLLAFMSIFYGSLKGSPALDNTTSRFHCVKLLHMPGKDFALGTFLMTHFSEFIGFLPVILISGTFMGLGFLNSLLLVFLIIGGHMIGEGIYLFVLDKTRKYVAESFWVQVPFWVLFGVLAYLPILLSGEVNVLFGAAFIDKTASIVLSIPFALGILILAGLSIYYQFTYSRYGWALQTAFNLDNLLKISNPQKTASQSRFKDVALKEADLVKTFDNQRINQKKGYAYLNALFFERHKRILLKPVIFLLAVIALGTFLYCLLGIFFQEIAVMLSQEIIQNLPIFVFLMYFLSILAGEKACRAMFNNCDISLLRYGFYRDPKVILENFRIRLWMMVKLNGMIALALCLFVSLGVYFSGVPWALTEEILFLLCILLLGLFFSVHHLFLYYVFQPYTTDLGMKNPFFKIISGGVYILCYMCLYIDVPQKVFTYIVLIATIIYIGVALALVYKLAPKNFRVK